MSELEKLNYLFTKKLLMFELIILFNIFYNILKQ